MKYSFKKQDGVVTATFTVSAEEWAEAMEQAYQKNKSKYSVQGFRKGHAPKKVIEILNAMKNEILCVRGNCDTEVDQMVLDFPILADYAILTAGSRLVYATHGHNFNENNLPPLQNGDILLHGHTHVPKCTQHESYVYLNPGSVSIPKEDSWHGYMTLESGKFIWKDFDGKEMMEYDA